MTASKWPDLGGRLIAGDAKPTHVLPIRVYFEDTDAGGIVYHASYVRWCERGRTDFLRLVGTDARRLIDFDVTAAGVIQQRGNALLEQCTALFHGRKLRQLFQMIDDYPQLALDYRLRELIRQASQ